MDYSHQIVYPRSPRSADSRLRASRSVLPVRAFRWACRRLVRIWRTAHPCVSPHWWGKNSAGTDLPRVTTPAGNTAMESVFASEMIRQELHAVDETRGDDSTDWNQRARLQSTTIQRTTWPSTRIKRRENHAS